MTTLIYEWGFYLKPGAKEEATRWLSGNERALAEATPEGLEYLGTFQPVWAPEPRCDMYQVWTWRRRDEGFNLRDAAGTDRGAFARLAAEFLSFVDDRRTTEETFRLHRSVVEAKPADQQVDEGG